MKILVIPDIHLKPDLIYQAIRAAQKHNPDKVIFLGDYFDDWGATMSDYSQTIFALRQAKDELGDKAVFLWGNHEYSYIAKCPCSGFEPLVADTVRRFIRWFPLQIAAQVDGYLFTHAGVTLPWFEKWFGETKKWDDSIALAMCLDFDERTAARDEVWFSAGPARGGTGTPSPLWADQKELLDNPLRCPAIKAQIIGHTPQREITRNHLLSMCTDFIFTDTFSNGNEYDKVVLLDTKSGKVELVACRGADEAIKFVEDRL